MAWCICANWPAWLPPCAALGIEPLLLKGYALADLVYPDPVTRPSHDLDVLVRPDQVAPACQVLAQIGCTLPDQATVDVQLANAYDLSSRAAAHGRPRHCAGAALGPGAARPLSAFDLDLWRARAEVFDVAGQPALRFSPEDMLLHLALHMRKHRYIGLRWLCDVAALLRMLRWTGAAPRSLDWEYVVGSAARTAGLTVLLYTGLAAGPAAAARAGRPRRCWPDWNRQPGAARCCSRYCRRRRCWPRWSARTPAGPGWRPWRSLLIDRPAAMARELGYRLLPPPEAVLGAEALGMSRGRAPGLPGSPFAGP
jgi:hypothetical protein